MIDYANDVLVRTFTKFIDGTSFVENFLLSNIARKWTDEFPRKTLK